MSEQTVLDRLISSLRDRGAPLDGQERPAAILWTDPKSEWRPLVDLLLGRIEELLVLDVCGARAAAPSSWDRSTWAGPLT